jgi:hypothetical protein
VKKNITILILSILLVSFFNFFENFYLLLKRDYNTRLNKIYSFCEKESVGFVNYVKNKYKFDKKIEIINFKASPDPTWVFYKGNSSQYEKKKIIFLNYKEDLSTEFIKVRNNYFYSSSLPSNTVGIKKIIFQGSKNLDGSTITIFIFHKISNEEKIILNKTIKIVKNNEANIDLNSEKLNTRNGNLVLKLKNPDLTDFNLDGINKIIFENKGKYNLSDFKILENINNKCYLLENYD